MDRDQKFISYCGKNYCAFCVYHKGSIVEAAKDLLGYAEGVGSLRLMADAYQTCDYEEFLKGLRWLSSQEEPCKGCRFGGGWSWWPDCPVRDCCIQKGVEFCYQCSEFPCGKLQEEPLLERKRAMIQANLEMKKVGEDNWIQQLKKKYRRTNR